MGSATPVGKSFFFGVARLSSAVMFVGGGGDGITQAFLFWCPTSLGVSSR